MERKAPLAVCLKRQSGAESKVYMNMNSDVGRHCAQYPALTVNPTIDATSPLDLINKHKKNETASLPNKQEKCVVHLNSQIQT